MRKACGEVSIPLRKVSEIAPRLPAAHGVDVSIPLRKVSEVMPSGDVAALLLLVSIPLRKVSEANA